MQNKHKVLLRIIKALNVILMILPFVLVWPAMYDRAQRMEVPGQTEVLLLLTISILYIMFGRVYDTFLMDVGRIHEIVYSQMLAATVTDCFGFVTVWMIMGHLPALLPFLGILPTQLLLSSAWSLCTHRWYFAHFPAKRTLIVTCDKAEADQLAGISSFNKKFDLVDVLSTDDLLRQPELLENIDIIFLLRTSNAWAVMQLCAFKGITVYRTPYVSEIIASRAKSVTLFHAPLLRMDGYSPRMSYVVLKRLIDVLASALALILLSPIMLIVAAAIKLCDGGPVFYRQERLTQGGKHFDILKFRSMRVNAEKDGVARLSTGESDPRITPVGRWIRKLRLDELPQLLNILKGDMSIVGPRPERPELTEEYARVLPEFKLRLLAKSGLTGYAQVYGKYNTPPEDKLRMDLLYILRPSLVEDLRIMLATVKILFVPESTEGVAEGQTSAMKDEKQENRIPG